MTTKEIAYQSEKNLVVNNVSNKINCIIQDLNKLQQDIKQGFTTSTQLGDVIANVGDLSNLYIQLQIVNTKIASLQNKL